MRLAAALVAAAVAAGCSSGHDQADPCPPAYEKAQVLSAARSWYLFPDLLPASVDLAAYPTASDLLWALTAGARLAGKDRGWSFITTAQAADQYFAQGQSVGFGFGLLVRGSQLFVAQVFAGSAAATAGLVRGDQILAVGDTAASLVAASSLIAAGTLSAALGPSEVGVTRTFQVLTQAGATVVRTVTKGVFSLDPVPSYSVVARAAPLGPAGYVNLRTFIQPAEAPLIAAFQAFQTAGVTDVVVDLRYDGGGLLSTAELLADLLGGGLTGTMYGLFNAPSKTSYDRTSLFQATAQSLNPARIAFITTFASASASELVPNALDPYKPVALVGARTYGKPVGQRGFQIPGCPDLLFLVSFQLRNATGNGDYFYGLPNPPAFSGPLCQAGDDLLHAQGDPAESSTATALSWLATGTCPSPPLLGLAMPVPPDQYPAPERPTPAQADMPGLF